MVERPVQPDGCPAHGATEEVAHAQAEGRAARHLDAGSAQALGPLDRRQPLLFHARAGRAVVDTRLLLTPAPLECKPGVGRRRGRRDVRQEHGSKAQPLRGLARVVAPEAFARTPAQIERAVEVVRVRARGVVDDGVRALPLELGVGPIRPLAARVLGQVDLVRALPERFRRTRRVEVDLGHLQVTFVLVGEVVERVIEPVLDRQPAGKRRIGGEVGVDACGSAVVPLAELALVVTPRP